MGSFNTSLSALDATNTAIDVVGNNLANLNTTGYKDTTVSFQDLVTESLGAGLEQTQVGFGVAPPVTIQQFTQGAIQTAGGSLDAAIQGQGFFVVSDPSTKETLYTRDGNFQIDASGNLLTTAGQNVQGWGLNSSGQVDTNAPVSNIQVQTGQIRAPIATQNVSLDLNLNASGAAGGGPGSFSTPIQVIDSLGNPMILTFNFTQSAANPLQWNYQVTVPGNATTGGTPGTPTNLLATPGTMTFNSSGQLTDPPAATGTVPIAITGLTDSAADLNINWNLYNSSGVPTVTDFAQASAVSANSQDGKAAAQLLNVAMATGGQVMAQYSDGTQQVVAQVAVAAIRNPDSLTSVAGNDYAATAQTALPAVGTANTGGRGQVLGGSLESSTVDIAQELTSLIVLQSAYEANAKVVTTVDQLTQTTVNLKT
ncbi:MAG TPA: flagellar hook protein FlgE [Bryobacteraceae bacterium]|nr:flagellar hook protein FlgE [Bryobacteraceae bacterium]